MKTLRIVRSMNPTLGGVAEAINQAASVVGDNSQMEVLCFDEPTDLWVNDKPYKVYAIGKAFSSYGFHFRYFKWLYQNAKRYDVVILDGLWQFFIFGGYLLKLLGVPYLVFTHGMLDPYFNSNKKKYLKKLPFWFFSERNVIAMSKGAIFTCKEESELAPKSFPLYKSRSFISTLGVTLPEFKAENARTAFLCRFPELQEKRIFLFLSRVHPKKGLDLLIEALSNVELPNDAIFAVAGPGEGTYISGLQNQAEKLGVAEQIHWLGPLSGEIKWGAYYAADAFILPSHQENFGIVVAEALSTGTPVLITNKVNIWREIEKVKCGLVENDDVAGVQKLLEDWCALPDSDKEQMRLNALTCYTENFSIEAAAESLEKVLLSVCKSGG